MVAATEVDLLRRGGNAQISSVNLAEVLDALIRRDGFGETEIRGRVDPLVQKELKVIVVTDELAWSGAQLRARHYPSPRPPAFARRLHRVGHKPRTRPDCDS